MTKSFEVNGLNKKTLIYAHRGSSSTHPENTMEAFEGALLAGADGIEFDVQLTKDGIPVIIHDETVDRTTNGKGFVKDYTLSELRELDAGVSFDTTFRGAKVPTLEEFFQWVSKTDMLLNMELKSGIVRYPGIEEIAIQYIEKYRLTERMIISSFNHYSLVEVKQLNNKMETAILYMEGIYEPWDYAKKIGAKGLHCFLPVAVPEIINGAFNAGLAVRPFTVNEEKHIYQLMKIGCTAIITDYPERSRRIRNSLE